MMAPSLGKARLQERLRELIIEGRLYRFLDRQLTKSALEPHGFKEKKAVLLALVWLNRELGFAILASFGFLFIH